MVKDGQDKKQVAKEEKKEQKDEKDWQKDLEEIEEKYKRALADYQNLVKRVQEEKSEWIRSANRELLLRILPILDTLMLAQKHSEDQTLKVTYNQFIDILKAEGVKKIETVGQVFDSKIMECVETIEGEDGKVVEEVRAGYLLHDKLLRPSLVKVGKKIEKEEEEKKEESSSE